MKKKVVVISVIAALTVAAGSVMATSMMRKGQITCPECGSEITLERSQMGKMPGKMPNIEEELAKKVESGEITQEEADAKKAEFEENMKNRSKKGEMPQRPDKNFEEELAKKVESGEITQEEADAKKAEFEENIKNRPQGRGRFEGKRPNMKFEDEQD